MSVAAALKHLAVKAALWAITAERERESMIIILLIKMENGRFTEPFIPKNTIKKKEMEWNKWNSEKIIEK